MCTISLSLTIEEQIKVYLVSLKPPTKFTESDYKMHLQTLYYINSLGSFRFFCNQQLL